MNAYEEGRSSGRRGGAETEWRGKWKLRACALFIAGLFLGVGYKSLDLQVLKRDRVSAGAKRQHSGTYKLLPVRGTIYDRNGKPLAANVPSTSLYLNPGKVKDRAALARALSRPLGVSREKILRLAASEKSFVWIKRGEDRETAEKIKSLGLGGVGFVEEPKRTYPQGNLLGQALGFTDIDLRGVEGLEYRFEKTLAGKSATVKTRRDAKGNSIPDVPLDDTERSTRGNDIVLTVDSNIQHITETELRNGARKMNAERGAALLMDPQTGEILAMASYPPFDPNRFGEFSQKTRKNLPVWYSFEPGSTLKVFLAAALLEENMADETTRYDCENGKKRIESTTIRDVHGHGTLTVAETIRYSSNICAWKMGRTLGKKKLYESLRRFGFGRKNGVDLPGEARGKIQKLSRWGEVELATISFGQGISVTSIQLVTALSSIANGGYLMKPYIVKKVVSPEGKVLREKTPEALKRVISYDTASRITAMLEEVVENGTGRNAKIRGYGVAGKTGTAQIPDPETRSYHDDRYLSSFMGFAPADDPKLALLVILENPRKNSMGGVAAAPIFRAITEKILFYMRVPPGEGPGRERTMPDMLKKSAREVMRWAEREEVAVRFVGNGYVASQNPPPGEKIRKGADCVFTLKQDIWN